MYPILFQFNNFTIEFYWLFMILGIAIGGIVFLKQAKRKNLNSHKAKYITIVTIISGFIGARICYVLLNLNFYLKDPLRMFYFWKGGFSWQGAFIIGTLAFIIFLRTKQENIKQWLDALIFGILSGHAIGRIGCFLHGCCYGIITNVPWAINFPSLGDNFLRHPTQLYEAFSYFIILLCLYFYSNKAKLRDGSLFLIGSIIQSFARFFIEYFRYNIGFIFQGNAWYNTLSYAQFASLIIIIIGILILIKINKRTA